MASILVSLLLASTLSSGSGTTQQGGEQGLYRRASLDGIERGLNTYLNGEEIQSVLTPGEFIDWKQNMKAGEVIVAEARSEAFDPAIEIVDAAGAVMTKNDDRYPGDQRPLVLWRCEKDGAYSVRVRCFHDKSGGQVFVRFKTYESLDLSAGTPVEGVFDATRPFFLRMPMKAGQVKEVVAEKRGEGNYLTFRVNTVIFPNGLPERTPSLSERLVGAFPSLVAPLDGDYYALAEPYGYVGGAGRVRVHTHEIVPLKPTPQSNVFSAKATTNQPALWEINVKAGDLLEASVPDLSLNCKFILAEAPDFSKFNLDKPETNPFFPELRNQPPGPGPAFDLLPARARDGRITVFQARRDARLWLASDGVGPDGKVYSLQLKPAAAAFVEDKTLAGNLMLAKVDYWGFDAKAGDVMTLSSTASAFDQVVVVRSPDLGEIRHVESPLDQPTDTWQMVVQRPGRYLVQLSALGDGGSGPYSLSRKVLPAKEFSMSTPAKGEIGPGQIQIWKFTVTPNKPLLVRWTSSQWNYGVAIYDDKGNPADFQHQDIDEHTRLGILKVGQPQTFVIVLTGGPAAASYSIGLTDVPKG